MKPQFGTTRANQGKQMTMDPKQQNAQDNYNDGSKTMRGQMLVLQHEQEMLMKKKQMLK